MVLRFICLTLALFVALALPFGGAQAQTMGWWLGQGAQAQPAAAEQPTGPVAPDYDAWAGFAASAEQSIEDNSATNVQLQQLRAQLVDWRERFLLAQNTNRARIETIRNQIGALGTAPAEGESESAEIAARRGELTEQLARLQAPGIAAEEAFRRADGLVREIDGILRERETDELLQLWPSPLNPANWPAGARTLMGAATALWAEVATNWADDDSRRALVANLPLVLVYLVAAAVLILRGRAWIENLTLRLQQNASARGREVWALVLSLGQILLPGAGVLALTEGLLATGMLGILGEVLLSTAPSVGFTLFAILWLASRIFPRSDAVTTPLPLPPQRRAEGRFLVTVFGLILAFEMLRGAVMDAGRIPAAEAAIAFPLLAVAGLLLFRLGHLLRISVAATDPAEQQGVGDRIVAFLGRAATIVGIVAPLLAAVGYVVMATSLIYPTMMTLGVLGCLAILQRLIGDIYILVVGAEDDAARDALIPALIGFALTLCTLPLLALLWGMRTADLFEIWARFREGITLGDTRLSPTDFLLFVVIFAIGYTLTRLFQGALRSSILPKTSLDAGGRNAITAGVGYVGIFLAALAAITSTGLDLSSLAIVAGALSVGIGFGLQNIVSNFVSGIILLIERPVAEGDWIEVGGVQGRVRAISVRSTRIETFDRTDVIVPNADLISGRVTNWTGFNLTGRLIVPIGVAYGTDTRKVERILSEIAEAQPLVVLNPPPSVVLMGFGDNSMDFELRVILRDVNFSLSVRSEINHEIARRFAEEGVEIPFPQRDLWLRNPAALQAPTAAMAGAAAAGAAAAMVAPSVSDMPDREPPTAASGLRADATTYEDLDAPGSGDTEET